jgi:hypothetical protein
VDTVRDMLEDSLQHTLEALDLYQKRIEELPKGSLSMKNINGHIYCYLAYREGKKVMNDYLGKLASEEVQVMKKKIDQRKRYQKAVKEMKKEIKFLRKALDIEVA